MAKIDDVEITSGMQAYIDSNNRYLAERDRYLREVVKKWRFDTIAVHGLYTVKDAVDDYQGSIIEPIFGFVFSRGCNSSLSALTERIVFSRNAVITCMSRTRSRSG